MSKNNMISVCIATYNGEKFIKQQLDSILVQIEQDDEIIISDDSSTDKTIEIIKSYNDPRISLLENCTFKSPIFNLENALKHAKGDYIFLSDQDDIWIENKVEVMKKSLIINDLVVSDCIIVDDNLKILYDSLFRTTRARNGLINNLIKNNYVGCCMAFRKKILKKVLPFPKDIPLHDLWIGFVAELFYKTFFVNNPLVYYRRHANAFSYTGEKSKFSLKKKLIFRINCLKYIPLLLFR